MSDVYKSSQINSKRLKYLAQLPSEHQNLFVSGDRFVVQNAGLTTSKGVKDFDKLTFISQKATAVPVFTYEGTDPISAYTRSCIHAFALTSLYDQAWLIETNPKFVTTLGVIITIIASYAPYSGLVDAGLEKFLARCHVKIAKTAWKTADEIHTATQSAREKMAEKIGLSSFDEAPQAFTVIALSSLILIGKNVTEVGRDGWFRNRWRALPHVVGVSMDIDKIEPPLLRPCQALYTTSSTNSPVRSCIFRIMRTLASLQDDQNHILFDRIIRLLQWAEMSHMWMIMELVFQQNSDILNFPELHGPEISSMMTAITFLKGFPKEDRAYLKLLHDHNTLTPLHSNNFIYFTAATHAIATITRSSMLNINSRFSEGVKEFQNRVLD